MRRRGWVLAVVGLWACGGKSPAGPGPVPTSTPTIAPTATPTASGPNQAPTLGLRLKPFPLSGAAPFTVVANMCTCSDPESDPLSFEYKWGGGSRHFGAFCRFDHTYNVPGSYEAWFCVSDGVNPSVCQSFKVTIT